MDNKNYKRFKDDIRKTFTIYALIPVIIITFSSYVISFSIWYRTVVNRNQHINAEVSKRIETIISTYINQSKKAALRQDILECIGTKKTNRVIYEDFYNFVNSLDIRCNFFVFDENMDPIIASSKNIPEYAQKGIVFTSGITKRMLESPDQVILAREAFKPSVRQAYTIGKAVLYSSEIIGYITFDLDETDLTRIISENFFINVVVTDQFSYVISSTNALLTDKFGKLDDNFKNKSGFFNSMNDSHYITKSNVLDGNISVYTITSIGYVASIFIIIGILLVILFCMLTLTTYFSAKRIANSKTRVIDEIIGAIENVQNGNLDMHLSINTNDEFQIIADSYNQMLIDIKNLIETNKEKARQNVLSEIKQLESQFNPHFLFNTLETVKYMAKTDPTSVNKIIKSLSALLRYSINNTITKVTLDEDIEYTKNYLYIQKCRFGDKFEYIIKVDEATNNCIVPKLIIQPIIENAVRYGFESRKHLCVRIKASFVEDNLVIVIYDDGAGMEPEVLDEIRQILTQSRNSSKHIGLFNVHRRVQLMYGDKYGVEILSEKHNGTVVKIILPINRSEVSYVESIDSRG